MIVSTNKVEQEEMKECTFKPKVRGSGRQSFLVDGMKVTKADELS